MAAEAKTGKRKWLKWVAIIVVVIIVALVLWYMWKGGATANKYASADSISKAKSGQYGKWEDANSTTPANWYQFCAKSVALFGLGGTGYGNAQNGGDNQAYASAWLRGMNISRNETNLEAFQTDIKKYITASFKKPDWEVTTGSFLEDKSTAA